MANQKEIRELYEEGCTYDEITSELFLSEENWNNGNVWSGYPVEDYTEILSEVTNFCNENAGDWEAERVQADIEDAEYMAYEGN